MRDLEGNKKIKWYLEIIGNAVTSYENDTHAIYFDYDGVIGLLEQAQMLIVDSARCPRPADLPEHLPWCEKLSDSGEVFDPYAYVDMSHEDYEKMHELMAENDESEDMEI